MRAANRSSNSGGAGKISRAQYELREMDELAAGDSPIHRLHPLCKLAVTAAYIATVVSFDKYAVTALAVMALYPLAVFQAAGIPVSLCFRKLKIVLPLVCAVGIVNPFLDRVPAAQIGSLVITGGVISMFTLMLKGIFSLMASFILIATTRIDSLCAALRMLHLPGSITTLLLLTYRYIGVMVEEVAVMSQAYSLRAPGQRGIHISAWGSFLGQLLLRSMDRAEELYGSMQLRGFGGSFYYADLPPCKISGIIFTVGCIAAFVLARIFDVAAIVGGLIVG